LPGQPLSAPVEPHPHRRPAGSEALGAVGAGPLVDPFDEILLGMLDIVLTYPTT
jgi:hypothetical protein